MIPTKIKVGGHVFRVIIKDKLNDEKDRGMVVFDTHTIYIKKGLDEQAKEYVFWHEILHIIDNTYNALSLGEKTVCRISEGLYQVLKDNFICKQTK